MAFNWAAIGTKISNMLSDKGQVGALRPESGPDVPCKFVVAQYDTRERDGSLIQFGDQKVYLSTEGVSVPPTTRHKLVIGGVPYRIVAPPEIISPAGTTLCYILQVR